DPGGYPHCLSRAPAPARRGFVRNLWGGIARPAGETDPPPGDRLKLLRGEPSMEEHKDGAPQPRLDTTFPTKLSTRVITYAWGENYIEDLLSLTIPALLAPGNLPHLASQLSCEVVILTEERLFDHVTRNPAIQRL